MKTTHTGETLALMTAVFLLAASSGHAQAKDMDYTRYATALKTHVDARGQVDYAALKRAPKDLNAFVKQLGQVTRSDYEGWSRDTRTAFWINAYNGLTLKLIIDNYPIKSSFWTSRVYPKNSIRQIDGAWTDKKFRVMARRMSLDDIEHQTLRKDFDEPRIHVALVCAAKGCPFLHTEPYTGARLDEQLRKQTQRFLAQSDKFRIDRDKKRVYLSSIFKWFATDFENKYGTARWFTNLKREHRAVVNFATAHLPKSDVEWLKRNRFKVMFLSYDWSLNER